MIPSIVSPSYRASAAGTWVRVPLLALLLLVWNDGVGRAASLPPHALNHVLIKFRPPAARREWAASRSATNRLAWLSGALALPGPGELREPPVNRLLRHLRDRHGAPRPTATDLEPNFDRFLYLQVPAGLTAADCVARLQHHPLLEYAELDQAGSGGGFEPNDPFFSLQWYHQNPVKPTASIHTPEAWMTTTGSPTVLVAVLDTGLAPDLADFAGRLVPGFNFVSSTTNTADDFGHGTAVTSVLAATGNNGLLLAGVDWGCRVMPVKVLDAQNNGYYSWWADGIDFAVANGAKVINLSAGGFSADTTLATTISNAIGQGVIFVTIAHNDGIGSIRFPGTVPAAITVGATDSADRRWGLSNYGPSLDLVAPGQSIGTLSTGGGLAIWTGTSFAAPMVSGVCALLAAQNPEITPAMARAALCAGADDQVGEAEDEPGFDPYYGWGRLNAYNTLLLASTQIDRSSWRPDGTLELSWNSPPNAAQKQPFRIEYASTPKGPWELIDSTDRFTYTASRTSWTEAGSETGGQPGTRFYRVRLWQP